MEDIKIRCQELETELELYKKNLANVELKLKNARQEEVEQTKKDKEIQKDLLYSKLNFIVNKRTDQPEDDIPIGVAKDYDSVIKMVKKYMNDENAVTLYGDRSQCRLRMGLRSYGEYYDFRIFTTDTLSELFKDGVEYLMF